MKMSRAFEIFRDEWDRSACIYQAVDAVYAAGRLSASTSLGMTANMENRAAEAACPGLGLDYREISRSRTDRHAYAVEQRRRLWAHMHSIGFGLAACGRMTGHHHSTVLHGLRQHAINKEPTV